MKNNYLKVLGFKSVQLHLMLLCAFISHAQVVLEEEVKITDLGLYFDGGKVGSELPNQSIEKLLFQDVLAMVLSISLN